jgi:hypothetical protein
MNIFALQCDGLSPERSADLVAEFDITSTAMTSLMVLSTRLLPGCRVALRYLVTNLPKHVANEPTASVIDLLVCRFPVRPCTALSNRESSEPPRVIYNLHNLTWPPHFLATVPRNPCPLRATQGLWRHVGPMCTPSSSASFESQAPGGHRER